MRPYTIVAAFDGTAEDEVRRAAANLLSTSLDESGIIAVLPDDQLRQGYHLAGKPDTLTLDVALARELAVRGAIRTVVAGTVDRVGRSYHLAAQVLDADSGTVIATERGVAESEDGVIPALDALARSLRKALGERPDRIAATREAGDAITPSLEAFQWSRRASEVARRGDLSAGREAYARALKVDPDFAAAWSGLGGVLFNMGYRDSAVWALEQALARPGRLTERNRLVTLCNLAILRRNPSAVEFGRRLVEEFGGSYSVVLGNALAGVGRFTEAAELMDEWERVAPFGLPAPGHFNHALWLAMAGRYREADREADHLPEPLALRTHILVSSQAGDWAAADSFATRALALGTNNALHRREFREALGGVLAARGRVREALLRLRENVAEYRPGIRDNDMHLLILALALASRLPLDARDGAPLAADSTLEGRTVAAIWQAAVGDTAGSRQLVQAVRTRPAEDHQALDSALTLAGAWTAAQDGRWVDVLRALEPVAAQGVFVPPRINALTRWLVAEARERVGALDSAAAMYERIATWSGFSAWEPRQRGLAESFARQRLVVLYCRMGRLDDARRHWEILSETFTQPDPEVAHLVDEARAALEEAERKAGK
jgi:tetratricopeptide (TPR) repeat protein